MTYLNLNGGLGFNRLSVIDITKNGHQPMANARTKQFISHLMVKYIMLFS